MGVNGRITSPNPDALSTNPFAGVGSLLNGPLGPLIGGSVMALPYLRRLALSALVLFGSLPILADEPTGELWETTSQMEMAGMPFKMPARPIKICAARDAQDPPGSANDERGCANTDMARVGSKVTWTSTCTGPPAMTGQGEITYEGTDAYTGTIKYTSSEGNMTINLTGKKIGSCDNPL